MTRILGVLFLVFALSTVVSAQPPGGTSQSIEQGQVAAREACDKIFNLYQNYTHNEFLDLISENYLPSKLEFVNAVEASLAGQTVTGLDYSIMTALLLGDQMMTQIRWDKKYQLKDASAPTAEMGIAMLIFENDGGRWKLVRVSGDNPF